MQNLFSLEGKVAIVTGGNGGIGQGIGRGFASMGAKLAIVARNEAKTAKAVQNIKDEFGADVIGLKVDVQQEEEIQKAVAKVLDTFGRIDILVNNAGTNITKVPQDYMVPEWDEILNVNLRSAFLCSKAVYQSMKSVGGGKIINIGSMTSIFGAAKFLPYATSKGGIVQLTRSLAIAWAPDNIQVNSILPGWINTDLTIQSRKEVPGLHEYVLARTPIARWGEPEDLSGSAIFLVSHASDFVTGAVLAVDGGYSSV
jgi:2-deoxy-D-gluconate 3-dehydrogenase